MQRSQLINKLAALALIGATLVPAAALVRPNTASAAPSTTCATPSCIPDMDAGAHDSVAVSINYNASKSNTGNLLVSNTGDVNGDGIPDSINYNASKSNTGNLAVSNATAQHAYVLPGQGG